MSRNFKRPEDVPNAVLAGRLNELSHAVIERMHGNEKTFSDEFTCRIPAEVDRDADIVMMEAAKRLRALVEKEKDAL